VIEDAAHALPTRYKGRMVGSRMNLTAFSFYATKNVTTAEGGALTGDPELLDIARPLSLHGLSRDAWKRFDAAGNWRYDIASPGFKYNMTDIQASLGIHQLIELRENHRRRRDIARIYSEAFSAFDALEIPVEREEAESSWHLYSVRIRPGALSISRDDFIQELNEQNIGSSVHFIPLHEMTYYREKYGYRPEDLPVAHDAGERLLSLPLHPRLSEEDVQDVIEAVSDIIDAHS
jgi:dTDP-4-amino-4,6-dideoxygalactose transaminase